MANLIPEGSPKEIKVFPITEEATNRALQEIAINPIREFSVLSRAMEIDNPYVNQWLTSLARVSSPPADYADGALLAYKIISIQAQMNGGKLPMVENDAVRTYQRDIVSQIKETGQSGTMEEITQYKRQKLSTEEPVLAKAIEEFSKYNPRQSWVWDAATEVYFLLKADEEVRKTRELLNK